MNIKEIRAVEIELKPKTDNNTAHTEPRQTVSDEPSRHPLCRSRQEGRTRLRFGMEPTCLHCNC